MKVIKSPSLSLFLGFLVATSSSCGAPDDELPQDPVTVPPDETASGGIGNTVIAPSKSSGGNMGSGGAVAAPHPLFGAGNYTTVEASDPCDTSIFWKVDTAIELESGDFVIYEGELWQLTGTVNENWAVEVCTPPGSDWCAAQYAWVKVGTCEET